MLLPLLLAALPAKGEPAITPQTAISGGERPPEQRRLHFDSADLQFTVLPEREALEGIATLTFTATAPLDRLVIDLDRNLPVTAVAIDGTALTPARGRTPRASCSSPCPTRSCPAGRLRRASPMAGRPMSR